MESKKHVFIDNDEERRDLILNVLDKYCVPRKVISETEECPPFGQTVTWYDIEINVNDKAWEFINGKVREVLALEDSYDMRCKPGIGTGLKQDTQETKSIQPNPYRKVSLANLITGLFGGFRNRIIGKPRRY